MKLSFIQFTEDMPRTKVVSIISLGQNRISIQFSSIKINRELEFVMDSPFCWSYCS
jgi:hypothetical protein